MYNCDFCSEDKHYKLRNEKSGELEFILEDDDLLTIFGYDEFDCFETKINYCPMCGRKLKTE